MKAQDLKKSILQLAIQGKLVLQDANDEPAEVLYAKIQAEKQKLIKEGKIKKDKPLPPITDDEIPFSIPPSWKWVRLGDIFSHNTGKALNSSKQEGKFKKYITTSNVYWNYFQLNEVREMRFNDDELHKCTVTNGDLLVCEGGDIGRAAIWSYDYDICIQNHIHRLRAYSEVCTMFFYYVFFLYKMTGYIGGKGIGIQGLSSGVLHSIFIPLPPLAEQKRIVAKIEELELLVKQYDKAETELSTLNESFPGQLKKSILQYAIQGKLVPQDVNDEPAEVLYAKIQTEKQKLIKEGKIKKDKPLPPITDDEIPFEIPSTWKWVRLKDICSQITDGEHTTPKRVVKSAVPLLTAKNIRSGFITYNNVDYVDENTAKKCWERCNPKIGDILMTCVGYIGRMSIFKEQKSFVIVRSVALIRSIEVYVEYLKYALEAPHAQLQMATGTKQTAQPCLYLNKINEIIIPLPPLAEQKRIVAKVTELMQYCEKLKV